MYFYSRIKWNTFFNLSAKKRGCRRLHEFLRLCVYLNPIIATPVSSLYFSLQPSEV